MKAKDSYLSHFQKYLGNLLQEEISTSSCRDQYGFAKVQWVADDRKTVIALSIHVSLPRAAMLGAHQEQNDNILLSYTTSLFHNDRMYKVAQRSYVGNCLSGELSNPENVYPEKAMLRLVKETRKASKMAARDFHGALGWELMGKCGGSGKVAYAYIPIEGNRFLHLYRSTFLRQSAWSSAGITLKTSDYGYSRSGEIAYVTFAESDEGLAEVKALVAFLRAGGSFSEWASMQKDQRNLNSQRA
ncbi:MAG: hypothetical protein EOP04_07090 [Proteobacteria bacterium]|nr:MAG: hypothetical protein EOP04_07090 [Pseudomonadota bacterium]